MVKIRKVELADNVVLYNGDSREVIPGLDLKGFDVCSDPPYGIEEIVGKYGRTGSQADAHIANDKNLKVVADVFTALRAQMGKRASYWVALFYSCRITPVFFRDLSMYKPEEYFGEMIWDKKTPGLGTQIRYQHENVAFWRIGKPEQLMDTVSVKTFASLRGERDKGTSTHPHEKPDQVMTNVVEIMPGKSIIDPFMGSGSTGGAAVRAKRGFVGIELKPEYFDLSCRKIEAALKQPVAFWE